MGRCPSRATEPNAHRVDMPTERGDDRVMAFSRIATAVAGTVAATLLPKSPVAADTFGTGGGEAGLLADSLVHDYCRGSIPGAQWDDAQAAMVYLDDATDLIDSHSNICYTHTDVRFDGGAGITDRGVWSCLVVTSPGVCGANRVQINNTVIVNNSPAGTAQNNLTKTVRHEVGHSVGLRHYKTAGTPCCPAEHDAMISGAIDNGSVWTIYSQHHKDHINDAY